MWCFENKLEVRLILILLINLDCDIWTMCILSYQTLHEQGGGERSELDVVSKDM